jgi:deoxyribose-phosphate aldolase
MADEVDGAALDEIAARVRRRLAAFKAGTEEPCTPSPRAAAASEAHAEHPESECGPSCTGCARFDTCATARAVRQGVARISPDRVRTSADIAPYIDHTLLKAEASRDEVLKLCSEARQYGFATVCVNSVHVATAARALAGSNVLPIAVVGFPLGAMLPGAKAFETREAIRCGAKEIDMVINIGALKSKDFALVLGDIQAVVDAAGRVPVKVILETSGLSSDEKIAGCVLSKAGGAAFVKTSTGFAGGGATAEDVALMRRLVGDDVGVKASGGVRNADDAMKMIQAGANRIGASASIAIVTGKTSDAKY